MKRILFFVFISLVVFTLTAQQKSVELEDTGSDIRLSNKLLTFVFNKKTASLDEIRQNGKNLLGDGYGNGYLMGPGFSMRPSVFKIERQTPELVEISFTHEAANGYFFELHYALFPGQSGIYCFLEQYHHKGSPDGGFGQIRWGLRADSTLFDYHLVRDDIQGRMPQFSEFKKKISGLDLSTGRQHVLH